MKTVKNIIHKYQKIPVAAKAGMWFAFCAMMQKCISFLTVPIFTRIMPADQYGIYGTCLSWHSILSIFCTLNLHNVIYVNNYTKAGDEKQKNKAAIPLLSLSFVITISVFLFYILFSKWLNGFIGLPSALVLLLFAQIIFEPPINFWTAKQRFDYNYISLVVRTIIMVLLNTGLGILFVCIADSDEAIARAFSLVIVQALFGILFYLYFWKRAKSFFSTEGWKHALGVHIPLLPHSLSLTVLSSSDKIMITNLVGAVESGIYGVAYSAGYIVNVLKTSIVDALRPWIYQQIKKERYDNIKKTANVVLIVVTMISVLFTAFAPEVIKLMAPSKYYEAIYVVPPVAASSYFTFLYNIFSVVGMYFEKTKKIMIASVSGAVMNIVLNVVFIPVFGYIAAAYTTLVCYIFFSIAHYLIMRSICKEKLEGLQIFDMRFVVLMSFLTLAICFFFTFTYKYGIK